jgi:heme-degrading monooxygenase HmoA
MAVKRIWHGWTTPENANKYQELLKNEVFPGIEAKKIPGYQSIELFRRDLENESEFITIMTFESIKSVIAFQGEDYEKSYVPDRARQILKRWEHTAVHYELVEVRNY